MRLLIPVLALFATVSSSATVIDHAQALQYFSEAKTICERDDGHLWKRSLCGPMLFVDPRSREAVTNQNAPDPSFVAEADGLYRGQLANEIGIANYSFDWKGERWTMVMWSLPQDRLVRDRLLLHEAWHRVQDSIGFPANDSGNAHLATEMGRTWLRLEWRALAAAIRAGDRAARRRAVEDALLFRAQRRRLFADAAHDERALEMHEGLAEYTGTELAAPSDAERKSLVLDALSRAEKDDSFVRSFAYTSGPAWGYVLDHAAPEWSRTLATADDLGDRAADSYDLALPRNAERAAMRRAKHYDFNTVSSEERVREQQRVAKLAAFERRYVSGPLLVVPLSRMQMQFDPNKVDPYDDKGNVYGEITVSDEWGKLHARGAMISSDFRRLIVPAPADSNALKGDGWELTLASGWQLGAGARSGDVTLIRASQ